MSIQKVNGLSTQRAFGCMKMRIQLAILYFLRLEVVIIVIEVMREILNFNSMYIANVLNSQKNFT